MGAGAAASSFTGVTSLVGAYSQYNASSLEGKYAQASAESNARMVERNAQDALRRGFDEAAKHKKKIKQLQGSQKAALAAQGIEISGDSALQILQETGEVGEIDAMTIRNNAYRESYGLKSQAIEYRAQGAFSKAAAQAKAQSSLITGGLSAFGNFYSATSSKNTTSSPSKLDARVYSSSSDRSIV